MGKSKTLDFSGVKDRKLVNRRHLPPGDYRAIVTEVDDDFESEAGNDGWAYFIKISKGEGKGATYPYYCMFEEKNLWKLRNLFVAAGVNIPKKVVKVNANSVVGKEIGITLEDDDPYEGRVRSTIVQVFPVEELGKRKDEDEDEDEEEDEDEDADDEDVEEDEEEEEEEKKPRRKPAPKARKKAKPKDEEEDEEEDDDEEEDEEIDVEEV